VCTAYELSLSVCCVSARLSSSEGGLNDGSYFVTQICRHDAACQPSQQRAWQDNIPGRRGTPGACRQCRCCSCSQ
jgi:hypothetical protein